MSAVPDASIEAQRNAIEAACVQMHARLICWGRLIVAGGNGPRERWESDDELNCYSYDAHDHTDAEQLNTKVFQLPKKQQSILLAVFYGDATISTCWHEFSDSRRVALSDVIAGEVNKHLRTVNRSLPEDARWVSIRAADVDAIRERAIRQLVNRERLAP